MGIASWWRGLWAPKAMLPAGGGLLLTGTAQTPPRRGTIELQQTYRKSPWLHVVVSTIGEKCSAATRALRLYDGPEYAQNREMLRPGDSRLDLLEVLRRPAGGVTAANRWKLCRSWRALCGEFGLVKQRGPSVGGRLGRVTGLVPIAPQWIASVPSEGDPYFTIRIGTLSERVHLVDFVWCVDPDPINPWGRGVGHGESLSDELNADEGAAKMIAAWFANGGMPDVIVSLKGANKDALKDAEDKWHQRHRGARKAHQSHFTNGEVEVNRLDTTFKDQELVALREYEARSIIQTFAISPEVFGILDGSTRNSIDAAYYHFSLSVLAPWLDTLCDLFQEELVPEFGGGCWLGYERSDVVPDDRDLKLRAIAVNPGAFRVKDLREAGGFVPDRERGDELLQGEPTATPTQLPGNAGEGADEPEDDPDPGDDGE